MAAASNPLVQMSCAPSAPAPPHAAAPPALRAILPREPDYQAYFGPVQAAVTLVARHFRLTPNDREELHSDLWVRLLADRGLALRRFHGLAKLETYLVTVARNLVFDRRNKLWGKWRPSAKAVRSGPVAVELERLVVRDGMSLDVAIACLRAEQPDMPTEQLDRLAASITPKARRRHISVDALADYPSSGPSPYETACARDEARCAASLRCALVSRLEALSSQDRNLLVWRYLENRSVAEIAKSLGVEKAELYRRCDGLLRRLRASLAGAGFDASTVMGLMGTDCDGVRLRVRTPPLPAPDSWRRSA